MPHLKQEQSDAIVAWLPAKIQIEHKDIKRQFVAVKRCKLEQSHRLGRRLTKEESEIVGNYCTGILDTFFVNRSPARQLSWVESLVQAMNLEARKQASVAVKMPFKPAD